MHYRCGTCTTGRHATRLYIDTEFGTPHISTHPAAPATGDRSTPGEPVQLPSRSGIGTLRAVRTIDPKGIRHEASHPGRIIPNAMAWGRHLWCAGVLLAWLVPLSGCDAIPITKSAGESLGAWLAFDRGRENWSDDYESAERRAAATHAQMAMCFTDSKFAAQDPSMLALHDAGVVSRLSGYVRATLVKSFEPDRRYAEQFGVTRAPSLILIHPDGTFHAHTGTMTAEVLTQFLDESVAPGAEPKRSPFIPRDYRFDSMTDLEAASTRARETQTPMIVAYDRRLTEDWRHLEQLLSKREVGIRISGLIHCRVRMLPSVGASYATPFGSLRLPALVVVRPDGDYDAIETPSSSAVLARRIEKYLKATPGQSETAQRARTRPTTGDIDTHD